MNVRIGDRIRIIEMNGEPQYAGREGVVRLIDDAHQIHGSWGGCAIVPGLDRFEVIARDQPIEQKGK